MTQLQAARQGIVTEAMRAVAAEERLTPEAVRDAVASGRAVIPLNPAHKGVKPTGVGRLFSTKINANLGRSPTRSGKGDELTKLQVALDAGAQFVMDLSVGTGKGADEIRAELRDIRQGMLEHSPAPLGTVPIYETISRLDGDIPVMDPAYLLQVIREQAEQGVDFMTLHAGLLSRHLPLADSRKMGIVSRGGAIMAEWMRSHGAENPLYTHWDEVMDILAEHDVTVSLGDGLRPGCLADASDEAQFAELSVLGELVRRCRERGVQAMVEGPGHIPFDQIQMNMEREQELCDGAPFYVLGPVVTDIASSPTSPRPTTTSSRPSAPPPPPPTAPASSATSPPPSTSASPTPPRSTKAASPTSSPPTPATSPAASPAPATATTAWPRPATTSTGTPSSPSPSTPAPPANAGCAPAPRTAPTPTTITAPCAARPSAPSAPPSACAKASERRPPAPNRPRSPGAFFFALRGCGRAGAAGAGNGLLLCAGARVW